MNYDPMAALDLEKRTGVKNTDIDDFLRKAEAVQEAIKGLKDGTLDPSKEIKIEGIETEEERISKVEELARKKEEYLIREAKKKAKLKQEEKDKWWRGAELFRGMDPNQMVDDDEGDDVESDNPAIDSETAKKQAVLQRYSNDYSRWEMPVVDDPATLAEHAELEAKREAIENAQFEKNNPDFCGEFRADQEKRAAANKEKESGANVLRLKGNRFFKAKKYAEAIEKYMASLKVQPYAANTLTNIAIAYHKKSNFDDALEFANRAVYLEPTSVKARCRRAATFRALGKLEEALEDANYALTTTLSKKTNANAKGVEGKAGVEASKLADSEHAEVVKLVEELQSDINDREIEKSVSEEAKKALVRDVEIEKKLKSQMSPPAPNSSAHSSALGFKKVAIDMEEDDDDESKESDIENRTDNTPSSQTSPSKPPLTEQPKVMPPPSIESLMNSLTSRQGGDPLADLELPSQYRIIDELMATLRDPDSNGITKSGVHALNVLSLLLKDSKEARVYLRTSEALMFLCCRLCGGGLAAPTPVSNVIGVRPDGEGFDMDDADDDVETGRPHAQVDPDPARTLVAIAAAVVGERRSKVLVRDQGVLHAAVQLVAMETYPKRSDGGASEDSMPARLMMESLAEECDSTLVSKLLEGGHGKDAVGVAALALLTACIEGVGGDSYAHFVAGDIPSLTSILSTLPTQPINSNLSPLIQTGKIRQFALASSLLQELCLIETCRDLIFKQTVHPVNSDTTAKLTETFRFFPETKEEIEKKKKMEEKKKKQQAAERPKASDPVSVLASSLECTQNNMVVSKCKSNLVEARESAVAALANLALHTAMRARFRPALLPLLEVAAHVKGAVDSKKTSKGKKAAADKQASKPYGETPAASAFALAALMNTLITEESMKQVLCENQSVSKLLQLLKNINSTSDYGVIRVRVAGLLGRLVSIPTTLQELRTDASITILSNSINSNCIEYGQNKEKWVLDEREHLVRLVAAVLSSTTSDKEEHRRVIATLHASNTLAMLVDFLPSACRDSSGKVTAASVVMPSPDKGISYKLSGNVVKSFVAVMDEPAGPAAQRLIKAGLLEKLVGLLANTQELSVRKNVAVVLARAMKDPPAMERVRELRGMEMLVQLGPQL